MEKITLEICAGSAQDCVTAENNGADRCELNSALYLGGLTPSLASLITAKRDTSLPIVCMVRPRGAGFCYTDEETEIMMQDARILLEHGADGLAFGFAKEDHTVDEKKTEEMSELIHSFGKEAVFHRAFDCVSDADKAMETLLRCDIDRVLTSGLCSTAMVGREMIRHLQNTYGNRIQILAGCGVNEENVQQLIKETGVCQCHSSAKMWVKDPTTTGREVSYAYHDDEYECVSGERVRELAKLIRE